MRIMGGDAGDLATLLWCRGKVIALGLEEVVVVVMTKA